MTPRPATWHIGDAATATLPDGAPTLVSGRVTVTAFAGQDVSGVAWTRVLIDGTDRVTVPGHRVAYEWDTAADGLGPHAVTVVTADGLGNINTRRLDVTVVAAPNP